MPKPKSVPTQEEQVDLLMKRFEEVNDYFIMKVAEQIKRIGELSQSSVNRIVIFAEMNSNMAEINIRLAKALQAGTADLYRIYNQALNDVYTDPRFARALTEEPLSELARERLEHFARSVSLQTAGTMRNLSNTTAVWQTYRDTVDQAILAVTSGLGDYRSATREAVRRLGYNGLQVQYESGYHRRLDTALRQNITNGSKQIAQQGSQIMGDELGYDAYELSAHRMSAPDHEPLQGRVYLKAEFEKMQSEQAFSDVDGKSYSPIRRAIGEWNCMHFPMSFSTKYSVRRYTDAQLAEWAEENRKGCEFRGKHMTLYEASQRMRELETEVRRQKDAANAARAAGDEDLRKDLQRTINALSARYSELCKASGLKPHRDRMRVNGFKMVKV